MCNKNELLPRKGGQLKGIMHILKRYQLENILELLKQEGVL